MPKRLIFIFVILGILSALSCCGRKELTPEETLKELYSVSDAFLNAHYGVTIKEAEEYEQLQVEIDNRVLSQPAPRSPGIQSLEDLAPDLAERYEALIKQNYQAQPLTDRVFSIYIERNCLRINLWKMVLKAGSDIKVTSVKTSLKNTDIDDEKNFINYTVVLLIDKTSYEVTGEMALVLVDNKWMIDGIRESGWSPAPLFLLPEDLQ